MKSSKAYCVAFMKRSRYALISYWHKLPSGNAELSVWADNVNKPGRDIVLYHATVYPDGTYTICRVIDHGNASGSKISDNAFAQAMKA